MIYKKKLAYLYRLTKKPQNAIEILEKLLKRGKIDFEICYNLAIAYVNIDELEQGKENLKKCISLEPDNPVARKDLGIVYLKMNYADWALDEFQTAINLEPNNSEHYFNYAVALYQTQEYAKADEYFKKMLELDKDNPAYLAYYGENLLALNKKDEAKEILLKTIKSGHASYKAKFTLAKIYFEDKNYKTSRDLLLDIKDAPNNPEILNLLAQNFMKLKEYKTAAGIFNKLTETYPNNHIILCDLAKCETKIGEYNNAKKHLEQALTLFPDFEYGLKILKEVQQNEPEQ